MRPEEIVQAERSHRDQEAAGYDHHRERNPYQRVVQDWCLYEELRLTGREAVVDAGCGTGRHLPELLRRGGEVVGVDHSARSLELALNRVSDDDRSRLNLAVGDLRKLPLDSASVDRALCCEVIQHIPTDEFRRQAVGELWRILRPGGMLVAAAYRWHGHIRRHREGFFDGGLYYYAFTPREFGALLRSVGFADVAVGGTVIFPRIAERLGINPETQHRLAYTPLARRTAHYVLARARRPA